MTAPRSAPSLPLPLSAQPELTPELSVNDVLRRWPETVGVFNGLGIDSCCGGAASLRTAAAEARVPLEVLLATLAAATGTLHAALTCCARERPA